MMAQRGRHEAAGLVGCNPESDAPFLHHLYGGIDWAATGNGVTSN